MRGRDHHGYDFGKMADLRQENFWLKAQRDSALGELSLLKETNAILTAENSNLNEKLDDLTKSYKKRVDQAKDLKKKLKVSQEKAWMYDELQ